MKYILFFALFFAAGILSAQPAIQWQKCYGGTKNDVPGGMIQTRDSGYIMAGQTQSDDGDVTLNHGKNDLWVVKINSKGAIEWQKTYGGSNDDEGGVIMQTFDGGYLIAASTNSNDGDLQGIHASDTEFDVWVLKIDSVGKILWQKTYGGSGDEFISSMDVGGEGAYILSAGTNSSDGDVKGFHGGSGLDIWVFEISETGTLLWQKTFGGTKDDEGGVLRIDSGNFAIIGTTYSNDGDVTGRNNIDTTSGDVWLVKLSGTGEILWQKTYGGSGYDAGNSVIQTFDHGFAVAGQTSSPNNGDVSGNHQPVYWGDCWIMKLDNAGTLEWQKCLGGSFGDAAYSIFQTSDSGYIVSGSTSSSDGDVTGHHGPAGGSDCWIFKLSKSGKLIWQETLGGSQSDANSNSGIMPTSDKGFLVATMTSSNDGDVSGNHGDSAQSDIWLVKLSQDLSDVHTFAQAASDNISLYPNPSAGVGKINYALNKASQVKIEIFNPLGEKLRTVLNTKEEAGNYEHTFDLSALPSGTYFFRIQIDEASVLKAVELIR